MGRFFNDLVSEKLFNEWAEVLDWLFDDFKFSKERHWNSGYCALFTKQVKKLNYLSDKKHVVFGNIRCIDFPNQQANARRKRTPYIMMRSDNSFGRDLIRHIRNGIAHGENQIFKVHNTLYIQIIDYSDKSKAPNKQTAFLCLPMS